jgi:hypothetical protein
MLQLRLEIFCLNHPQEESSATFKKIQKIKIGREAWAQLLAHAEKMIPAHREGDRGERLPNTRIFPQCLVKFLGRIQYRTF